MSSIDVSTQCNFFLMNKPNVKRKSVACNIIKPQEKPKELLKNQAKPKTKTTQCFLMPFNLNIKVKTFDKFTNTIDPPKNLEIATKTTCTQTGMQNWPSLFEQVSKTIDYQFSSSFSGDCRLKLIFQTLKDI